MLHWKTRGITLRFGLGAVGGTGPFQIDPTEQKEWSAGSFGAGMNPPASPEASLVDDGLGTTKKRWTTSSIDFSKGYSNDPMSSNSVEINICKNHFPTGSTERSEILVGLAYYTQVSGLDLSISVGKYDHQSINDRFDPLPKLHEIKIDYANNIGNEGYIPCHTPKSDDPATRVNQQWGFVGNSCPHSLWGWNSGGDHNASRVSVNPVSVTWSSSQKKEIKKVRYRHFWDVTGEALPFEEANPNATGYALSPLFSHEVGHSLGMNHSDEWPAALGMVSTMQSFIRTITPFDLAFLKHFYGLKSGESAIKKSDLTASHLVRYNKSESDSDLQYKNYNFGTDSSSSDLGRINPLYLYYSNGQFLDCRTSQTPRFHATWFNNGTQEIKGSSDLIASFTTHSLASLSTTLTLGSFEIGDMEGLSQRYWSGQVLFPSADVAMPSTSSSEVITVSFTLDPKHKLAEASEANNTVTAAVTLYRSKASCSRQPAKNAVAGYLDSDGRISGYP